MTREQALETLKEMAFTAYGHRSEALEMAISVLSADGDLISRQTAIDAFERFIHELGIKDEPYNYGEMALSVQNVPSVENKGEPCEDYISRKDAIQALKANGLEELFRSLGVYPWNVIKMLPSVQPVIPNMIITVNDSYMRNVRRDCGLYE